MLFEKVGIKDVSKFGITTNKSLTKKNKTNLIDIIEKPSRKSPSQFAAVGRYVLNPDIFSFIKKIDESKKIELTDAIRSYIKAGNEVTAMNLEVTVLIVEIKKVI